jgi:hypothetical protein
MSERLIAAVEALEGVICERYNVSSLTGVGPFAEALAQARVGNVGPIQDALRGREMYRWRETAEAALEAVKEAVTSAPIEPEPEPAPEQPEPVTLTESGTTPRRRSRRNG